MIRIIGTFQSRDVADSVKDAFLAEGFSAESLVVMTNREAPEPPEDARLEVGTQSEGGLAGVEEKIGKAVLSLVGKRTSLDGDGSEGDAKGGALLGVTIADATQAARVQSLLERHHASDIEVTQPD